VTLTVSPRPSRDRHDAEALIEEARRLHRRRQRRWLALGAAAALLTAGLVAASHRGGPPHSSPRPPSHLPDQPPPVQRRVQGPSLGPARAYQLTGPIGVAVNREGDVYFSDGNRILEIDHATQELEVIAGTGVAGDSGDGGPGPQAEVNSPAGVAVAPNGDVYFEDGASRIRMVSASSGIISTVAGDGRPGNSGDGGPAIRASLDFVTSGHGVVGLNDVLAFDPRGDLYMADGGNNEVREVSLTTGNIDKVTGGKAHCAPDNGLCLVWVPPCPPVGVAVDRSSDVFVATACGAIREVSGATGAVSTIFSTGHDPALTGPVGLAVLGNETLLVTEADGRRLLEIDLRDGKPTLEAGTGSETLPEPQQTAGDGGPASKATFGLALGAAVDRQGDVYVADFFNNAIRMIDGHTGVITTIAGQIPTSPAAGHCC
jgi:hypothetical protein